MFERVIKSLKRVLKSKTNENREMGIPLDPDFSKSPDFQLIFILTIRFFSFVFERRTVISEVDPRKIAQSFFCSFSLGPDFLPTASLKIDIVKVVKAL